MTGVHDGITLNTFKRDEVLEVYDRIVKERLAVVNKLQSISRCEASKKQFLKLHYEPMFDLIYLTEYDGGKLFSNPCCTTLIASTDNFISALKPSEQYFKLMEP